MVKSSSKNIRILVVDDFDMVRTMLRNILSDLGYVDLDDAANGAIALDMIGDAHKNGTPYDIVFCDWNMPEVTGFEVLEVLRRTPTFATLPFVMVTAESDNKMVTRALAAGANDYIVKPFQPAALDTKIKDIVLKLKKGL